MAPFDNLCALRLLHPLFCLRGSLYDLSLAVCVHVLWEKIKADDKALSFQQYDLCARVSALAFCSGDKAGFSGKGKLLDSACFVKDAGGLCEIYFYAGLCR